MRLHDVTAQHRRDIQIDIGVLMSQRATRNPYGRHDDIELMDDGGKIRNILYLDMGTARRLKHPAKTLGPLRIGLAFRHGSGHYIDNQHYNVWTV